IATTVTTIARPGKTLSHQASRSIVREEPIMYPQLIMFRSPRPKKESALSVRIAVATISEAITTIADMALGRMCRKIKLVSDSPRTTAALTNSRDLRLITSPRTRRATGGHDTKLIARTIVVSEGEKMATNTI